MQFSGIEHVHTAVRPCPIVRPQGIFHLAELKLFCLCWPVSAAVTEILSSGWLKPQTFLSHSSGVWEV